MGTRSASALMRDGLPAPRSSEARCRQMRPRGGRRLACALLQRALQIDPDPQADAIIPRGEDLNVKVFAGLVKSGADA